MSSGFVSKALLVALAKDAEAKGNDEAAAALSGTVVASELLQQQSEAARKLAVANKKAENERASK
jgi:hypothetical protein